jgi:hypothetical protein
MHDLQNSTADNANQIASQQASELIINGTRYGNTKRVAEIFDKSDRTIARWVALRIGPPLIKIGKLILFNLDRLPEWLAQHEEDRPTGRRRQGRAGR